MSSINYPDSRFVSDVTLLDGDLLIDEDGKGIYFGEDQDVYLQHVADTGLLLNAAMKLGFRDSAVFIHSDNDGDLRIEADEDIDIGAAVKISLISPLIQFDGYTTSVLAGRNNDDDQTVIQARDNGVGLVEIARMQSAADPYFSMGGSQEFKFYNSGYALVNNNSQLHFRDAAIYIKSDADGQLALVADVSTYFYSPDTYFINGSGNAVILVRSTTDDAKIILDSGDDGTPEESIVSFRDDRTEKWKILKDVSNHLVLYDSVKGSNIMEFADNSNVYVSQDFLFNTTSKIQFRDSAIYIYSGVDGNLELIADSTIITNVPTLYQYHADGDATLLVRSGTDNVVLQLDSGDDATTEESQILFQDDRVTKWGIHKGTGNELYLYDNTQSEALLTFTTGTPSTITIFEDTLLQFRDAGLKIYSNGDGYLDIDVDTGLNLRIGGSTKAYLLTGGFILQSDLTFDTTKNIKTPNTDDTYFVFQARDSGVGLVEVGRVQGAADPYMQFTLAPVFLPVATGSLPATPVEGMMTYDATLNKMVVWTGAAWETVTSV